MDGRVFLAHLARHYISIIIPSPLETTKQCFHLFKMLAELPQVHMETKQP